MSADLSSLTPLMKAEIARQIHSNIEACKHAGDMGAVLVAFLPELAAVAERLSSAGDVKSAEADWAEMMVRLRGHIGFRARKLSAAASNEANALLKPLLDALKTLRQGSPPGDFDTG